MKNNILKISIFITAILWLMILSFPAEKISAESNNLTCPLEKEIPLGQIVNQTEVTGDKILQALKNLDRASLQLIRGGKKMIDAADSCEVSKCQSSCSTRVQNTPKPGTPTGCTTGYTCNYQPGNILAGDHPGLPQTSCKKLNLADSSLNPLAENYYAVSDWRENQGYPCSPHSCPDPGFDPDSSDNCALGSRCDYQGYKHSGQAIINNNYSRENCQDLQNNLVIDPLADYAIYQYDLNDDGSYDGWCNVLWPTTTCSGTCYNEGECAVNWTLQINVCQNLGCQGTACNQQLAQQQKTASSTAKQRAITAYQGVNDVFYKYRTNLEVVGEICQWPFMNLLCDVFGGDTEWRLIMKLVEKAIININNCYNNPADFFKILSGEKSGKFLLRCQELTPIIIENCYPDNFFCCY